MTRDTRELWLKEGLNVLASRGPEGLTIDELCRCLRLTKGSFYHHFKNRQMYIHALLGLWEREMTLRLINISEAESKPGAKIRRLTELSGNLLEEAALEIAIRSWASQNEVARLYQERVDRKRQQYLRELLAGITGPGEKARELSRILYAAYVGAQHILPPVGREEFDRLYGQLKRLYRREEKK